MKKMFIAMAVVLALTGMLAVQDAFSKSEESIIERLEDGKVVKVKVYKTWAAHQSKDGFYTVVRYIEKEGYTDEQIKEMSAYRYVLERQWVTKEKLTLKAR